MNSDKGLVKRDWFGKWALGILLVVFVLWEANHLQGFSQGYDEGLYLTITQMVRSGYTLYKEISHPHGPLFIYSIVPAFELLGPSAAAGRFVTVLYGAVGLLLVALTARELGGWLSGLSAVVLLSLSPEFFRLSRSVMPDVQTYTMTTLAILSSLHYLKTGRKRWLFLAGLAFGLGGLFKLIVIPALLPLGLAVLCFHIRQEGLRSWHKLLGDAALVLGIAILPPLICLLVYGWQPLYYDLIAVTVRARTAFPFAPEANIHWIGEYLLDNAGLTMLAVWGTILLLSRRSSSAAVVISWGAVALAALVFQTPLFFHQMSSLLFPMSIVGGYVMGHLEGHLTRSWKPATWRGGIALLISIGTVAGYIVTLPNLMKDYRAQLVAPTLSTQKDATHFISTMTWPDDWIVTDDPAVAFWADRMIPPPLTDVSFRRVAVGLMTDDQLITLTEQYQPQAIVALSGRLARVPRYLDWAKEHYWLVKPYGEEARIYYLWKHTSLPPIQHPRQEILGQQIRFLGYDLHHPPYEPGGQIYLTLYWQALDRIGEDHTVFTHLLDSKGQLRAQKDNPPVNGLLPISAWEMGEIIQDRYIIPLDPDLPPGEYQLEIGMYQVETEQRLEVREGLEGGGDRILLDAVEVSEPKP